MQSARSVAPATRLAATALRPMVLLRAAARRFLQDDMPTHTAAVTYQLLFSVFPFLIFLLALLGFLHLDAMFDWLRQQAEGVFLPETVKQINALVDQIEQRCHALLSVAVTVALWTASSGVRATAKALNVVFRVPNRRPLWRRYAVSVPQTLVLGLLLALAAMLALVDAQAMLALLKRLGMPEIFASPWRPSWLRWPVVLLLLALVMALVYGIVPDTHQRIRLVSPGAVLASAAWIGATAAFEAYVRSLSRYEDLYGSVGTIIVLMIFCYFSVGLLLLGAELDAVIDAERRGQAC